MISRRHLAFMGILMRVIYCANEENPQYDQVLISKDKPAQLTTTLNWAGFLWNASLAVDGNARQDNPDKCRCCAASSNTQPGSIFTLNLEDVHMISRIEIFGRNDHITNGDLTNAELYLSNQSSIIPTQKTSTLSNLTFIEYTSTSRETYQYVMVKTTQSVHLLICEIRVYTQVCKDGFYGDCKLPCGECYNHVACNKTTAVCPNGCELGYHEDTCQQPCDNGYYGNCTIPCGNCKDGETCDKANGTCPTGCAAGYEESLCTKECDRGKWGENCFQTCGKCIPSEDCDRFNGHCTACEPGYKGEICKTPCEWGKYGDGCTKTCGYCVNNETCNISTGICDNGCGVGYTDTYCDKKCDEGAYGLNCNETCGFCKNNQTCDVFSGNCSEGCSPGYKGTICKTRCSHGEFGENCIQTCHCAHNASCDPNAGVCSNGLCEFGYIGETCSEDLNIIPKYKNVISVNMSSTWDGIWVAERAIDGDSSTDADKCECCSATKDSPNSYWQIDFGFEIPVMNIQIYGRTPVKQISDSVVYIRNSTDSISLHPIQTLTNNPFHNISVPNILVEAIRIQRPTGVLTLCEVKVYRGICPLGRYGFGCSKECNCLDNKTCDFETGKCQTPGCKVGWQGAVCDQVCSHARFGLNCSSICNCYSNASCNHITGVCDNYICSDGWRGQSCNTECTNKTFGKNCSTTCNCLNDCHHIHGNCTTGGCLPGWQGSTCTVKLEAQPIDESSPGPIVGGVVGAIILCAAVLVVFLLLRRRRRRTIEKSEERQLTFKNNNILTSKRRKSEDTLPDEGVNVCSSNSETAGDEGGIYANNEGIKINELWNYIKLKSLNNCNDFLDEYRSVPKKLNKPASAAALPGNIGKNRYKEMHPYDENRVQLTKTETGEGDYINASYIDGVNFKKKFIASQGPQEYMVDDFWRMIWDKKARKIIMLTNVYDNDSSRKIVQYWSDEGSMQYGKLSISVLKCVTTEDYAIRDMRITHEDGSTHDVTQFHFKSWPDKDVPSTAWSLVNFWRMVDQISTPKQPGKIVVHCSAGVGRTGTYIALDILYNEAILYGEIKPVETLRRLREQRICMVQTKEQYVYLHEAVAEALHFGTHHVLKTQFEDIFKYMMGNIEKSTKTRLQQQFEVLKNSLDQPMPGNTDGVTYGNIGSAQSEINAYKPSSSTWNSDIYPDSGALSLPLYTGENGLIICKLPSDSRLNEFWKMVQDGNIKTVVFIQEKSKLQSPKSTVKLFEFANWKKGQNVPKNPSEMLSFLESVIAWQPKVKVAQPIIVCCSDGVTQSGLLCVLLNELYRMKDTNGQINIVESVKIMKHRNRKLIPDFSQYKFCHEVIREACTQTEEAVVEKQDLIYENEQLYQNVSMT